MATTIKEAREFAIKAHGEQKYGMQKWDYVYHLDQVVNVLMRFGHGDQLMLSSGYLHDVLEDVKTINKEAFRVQFEDCYPIVFAVTEEPGKNRRERHSKTLPKIKENPRAVILKLADRIANAENCQLELAITGKSSHLSMYQKEWKEFHEALYAPGQDVRMWQYLEELCTGFRVKD
jgi:(p)ppGpp synthase/HD superfamily hydrolase